MFFFSQNDIVIGWFFTKSPSFRTYSVAKWDPLTEKSADFGENFATRFLRKEKRPANRNWLIFFDCEGGIGTSRPLGYLSFLSFCHEMVDSHDAVAEQQEEDRHA